MKTTNPFIAAACDQAGEVCELTRPAPAREAGLGEIEQAVQVNVAEAIREGQP